MTIRCWLFGHKWYWFPTGVTRRPLFRYVRNLEWCRRRGCFAERHDGEVRS